MAKFLFVVLIELFMLTHQFQQTIIYESNTRLFSKKHKCKISKDLAEKYLNLPEVKSSHYLWAMGIWQKSPYSVAIARTHEGLKKDYKKIIPNYKEEDIIGSPYAIYDYIPEPDICESWEKLKEFKETLNQHGIGLILDYVPNHMARDTPWINKYPEAFLSIDLKAPPNSNYFLHPSGIVFAHGKDPHFDGWTDTVQFDFSHTETFDLQISFLERILPYCDGLRCDMAMLPLPEIFEWTHGKKGLDFFWEEFITKAKSKKKDFLFIAEVYWNLESKLQYKGFDFTYEKDLYDFLVQKNSPAIIHYLQNKQEKKSLHFLENHDENRMASVFFLESIPFFSLIANLEGGLLIHEGQTLGYKKKIPVQLGTYPSDEEDSIIQSYFQRIIPRLIKRKNQKLTWIDSQAICYEGKDKFCFVRIFLFEDGNREIFIFNPNPYPLSGRIPLNPKEINKIFQYSGPSFLDLTSGINYGQNLDEIKKEGIYFYLEAWRAHWFLLV